MVVSYPKCWLCSFWILTTCEGVSDANLAPVSHVPTKWYEIVSNTDDDNSAVSYANSSKFSSAVGDISSSNA